MLIINDKCWKQIKANPTIQKKINLKNILVHQDINFSFHFFFICVHGIFLKFLSAKLKFYSINNSIFLCLLNIFEFISLCHLNVFSKTVYFNKWIYQNLTAVVSWIVVFKNDIFLSETLKPDNITLSGKRVFL